MLDEKSKKKVTIYLTEDAELAFTELYIHRLRKDRKCDKSQIVCDAIKLLYKELCNISQDRWRKDLK